LPGSDQVVRKAGFELIQYPLERFARPNRNGRGVAIRKTEVVVRMLAKAIKAQHFFGGVALGSEHVKGDAAVLLDLAAPQGEAVLADADLEGSIERCSVAGESAGSAQRGLLMRKHCLSVVRAIYGVRDRPDPRHAPA